MAELPVPPQSVNIASPTGTMDPAWFQWFQEVWDKSRQGFQGLVSQTIESNDNLEFIITDKFAGFKDYKIVFNNVLVSQPDSLLYVQISKDSGSSYENNSADYSWVISLTADTSKKLYDNEDSQMQLEDTGLGNSATNIVTGEIVFYDLAGESEVKFFAWNLRYKDMDDNIASVRGAGSYNNSGKINGIKIFPSQGVIASGELEIFGSK